MKKIRVVLNQNGTISIYGLPTTEFNQLLCKASLHAYDELDKAREIKESDPKYSKQVEEHNREKLALYDALQDKIHAALEPFYEIHFKRQEYLAKKVRQAERLKRQAKRKRK